MYTCAAGDSGMCTRWKGGGGERQRHMCGVETAAYVRGGRSWRGVTVPQRYSQTEDGQALRSPAQGASLRRFLFSSVALLSQETERARPAVRRRPAGYPPMMAPSPHTPAPLFIHASERRGGPRPWMLRGHCRIQRDLGVAGDGSGPRPAASRIGRRNGGQRLPLPPARPLAVSNPRFPPPRAPLPHITPT